MQDNRFLPKELPQRMIARDGRYRTGRGCGATSGNGQEERVEKVWGKSGALATERLSLYLKQGMGGGGLDDSCRQYVRAFVSRYAGGCGLGRMQRSKRLMLWDGPKMMESGFSMEAVQIPALRFPLALATFPGELSAWGRTKSDRGGRDKAVLLL